ncbi:MAG: hypothetical protein PHC80_07465 [Eubacteriales bacterium]|nr:hypothetical protein [Eubacteriales bacterium]
MKALLQRAKQDAPVYLSEVRKRFDEIGVRPFRAHVTLYDDSVRVFSLPLPYWTGDEERTLVRRYVYAVLYNILSALGAKRIDVYVNTRDAALLDLAEGLEDAFDVALSKGARQGYGKCLNVNERIVAALCGGEPFHFRVFDVAEEPSETPVVKAAARAFDFAALPARTAEKLLLGMDIGGTDVKLVAAYGKRLLRCVEYDWNPAAATDADGIVEPLCALASLLLAQANLVLAGRESALADAPREASAQALYALADEQTALLQSVRPFDGIGLCFPDVVVHNAIIGGETAKTKGIRENLKLDYEKEFAKIGALHARLAAFVVPGGPVADCNDGNMAAFTAAVESAVGGEDVSAGFFAHTLGTELGTGYVEGGGRIPALPLEVYNFIIDLGSDIAASYEAADARSNRNVNTGLPGTLQRYASQSGAFRLAAKYIKEEKPSQWAYLLEQGLFEEKGGLLFVPAAQRKAALAFLMEQATAGESVCCDIFREIGEYLGETWKETNYILRPAAKSRALYGRMVKDPACFALLFEGARRRVEDIELYAANESLAHSPLMRSLASSDAYTVAQFGQAVGAVHYSSCTIQPTA